MYCKRIIYSVVVFIFSLATAFAEVPADSLFVQANNNFEAGNYTLAVEKYEQLLENGVVSENLYYNLATAYFKTKQNGKSILYYEKALELNSKNKATKHNLKLVNNALEKKLDVLPELFFVRWWNSFRHLFSSNAWAYIALLFAWFALLAFAYYLFSKNTSHRKVAFGKLFVFGFLALFSLFISFINAGKLFSQDHIVLVAKESISKEAPSENSSDTFPFYEGAKFKLLDKVDGFYKVKAPEGDFVWLKQADCAEI